MDPEQWRGGPVGCTDRVAGRVDQGSGGGRGEGAPVAIPDPGAVELEFQAAVTQDIEGNAGIRWWLVSLGGKASRDAATTHTVRLKLSPVIHDPETGETIEAVEIDSARYG